MKPMTRLLILLRNNWVACTAIALAAVTVLSLWPLSTLPEAPGGDKTHHLLAYALVTLPLGLRKPRRWGALCLLIVAYSGMIELLQPFVHRYGEWLDLFANSCGVAGGFIAGRGANRSFQVDARPLS